MGPRKPQRSSKSSEDEEETPQKLKRNITTIYPQKSLFLETSFTSIQSPSSLNGSNPLIYIKPATPVIDLIHDDWFGLAPLASPESLSEVSSISSRASMLVSSTPSQVITNTPRILKRTPKIIGNLSTCADDIRNVRNFEMAKVFHRNGGTPPPTNSSGSNLSYESVTSSSYSDPTSTKISLTNRYLTNDNFRNDGDDGENFQSAEDILDSVLTTAGCKEFFDSSSFEFLEEPIKLNQIELDSDAITNYAIDLNLDEEHRSLQFRNFDGSKTNSIDSGSICRTPDTTKNVTFNPQVINIDIKNHQQFSGGSTGGVSWNNFFKRNLGRKSTNSDLMISTSLPTPKTILLKRHYKSDEECFIKGRGSNGNGESLPLLSGLSSACSERTSPNFVRRKKYIYPIDLSRISFSNGGSTGESSV